ncbi:hypothetical protein NW757_013739 [Fusarium falciforme]|nr:hypothetical protein NW757_013739 [Fusarium falciforme]
MPVDQGISQDINLDDSSSRGNESQAKEPTIPSDKKIDRSTTGDDPEDTTPPTEANRTGKRSTKGWLGGAQLFCRVNGRCHADLIDFDFFDCPLCDEYLEAPINLDCQSSSDDEALVSDNKGQQIKGDDHQEETPTAGSGVSYSVEYIDHKGVFLGRAPWNGIFDLEAARQGAGEDTKSIFEVVTVLHTSIAANPGRQHNEGQRIAAKGILQKSNVSVAIAETRLTIYSTLLIKLLREFVRYYPSINLESSALQLYEPFPLIAHHYKELSNYRASHVSAQSAMDSKEDQDEATWAEHLEKLLDYYDKTVLPAVIEEEGRHKKGLCTFRMLWLLYKPGETVYLESQGCLSAFVVQSVRIDPAILKTTPPNRPKPYTITVWHLAYDGQYVGRTSTTVTVAPFEGERRIVSLRLIPCSLIDKEDGGATRRRLEENGRRWYELLPGRQVTYSGPLLGAHKRQLDGRVYIDPASFYMQEPEQTPEALATWPAPYSNSNSNMNKGPDFTRVNDFGVRSTVGNGMPPLPPGPQPMPTENREDRVAKCQCEECCGMRPHPPHGFPWTRYDILDPTVEKNLEIPGAIEGPLHRYLLCDHLLHGFDLKSRTWVQLDVAHCRPTKANFRAIDSLVMPNERLNMIKALIQKFTNTEPGKAPQRAWAADFIENKGEGQIFLLHRGPGVGKTYTAECIAEYTERPLLSLTCGDIGTDEVKMEVQLSKWFRLAEKWGAVMLIDEADVYLERRLVTDLKRNSLVSVFLRCIEYYRGVLFLTTNRVGQFDDAFISRIHVIIRYDNLSAESRKKIWSHFFDKLDDEREDFKTTRRAKDYVLDGEISKIEWNGREIRNGFQTAVALAEFRFLQNRDDSKTQPTLDQKDFEQVLNMMQQFKTYLINVHGSNEEERAYGARSRAPPYLG